MKTSAAQDAFAIPVARLYYYQGLTTEAIAAELGLSRPRVSRLLSFARRSGLVEIQVHDPVEQRQELERRIQQRYGIASAKVISVPRNSQAEQWLDRVAAHAASHLNSLIRSEMVVGIGWGKTLHAVSRRLSPKNCTGVDVVQLNGFGDPGSTGNHHASEIYSRFAENYGARTHLFPVPAFFDCPETKRAMWRERSVRRHIELAAQADLLVFSVGAALSRSPNGLAADGAAAQCEKLVGSIATAFFRADGTYADVPLNSQTSGPDLALLRKAKHSLCIVSGLEKAVGLHAALRSKFMTELIVDEPTARAVLDLGERRASPPTGRLKQAGEPLA